MADPTTSTEFLKDWFGNPIKIPEDAKRANPCVRAYGPGPDGKVCKTCIHLIRKQLSKVYLKCAFRKNTSGPGTDHKAGWSACAKYEEP